MGRLIILTSFPEGLDWEQCSRFVLWGTLKVWGELAGFAIG